MINKYNIKYNGLIYKECDLISGIDEYREYMLELNNKFDISKHEIETIKSFVGHGHSLLTGVSGMFCGMIDDIDDRQPMLDHLSILKAKVLSGQLTHILNGDKLVINNRGGYFSIKENEEFEILDVITSKYTESDIRINKWLGGRHYYAKVRNIDVIDTDGGLKWNTEQYARSMAIKFIEKLNK